MQGQPGNRGAKIASPPLPTAAGVGSRGEGAQCSFRRSIAPRCDHLPGAILGLVPGPEPWSGWDTTVGGGVGAEPLTREPGRESATGPGNLCARKAQCKRTTVPESHRARKPLGSPFGWPRKRSVRRSSHPQNIAAQKRRPRKHHRQRTRRGAATGARGWGLGVPTGSAATDRNGRRSGRCSARQSRSCWRGRGGPGPRGPCWGRSRGRSRDRGFRN